MQEAEADQVEDNDQSSQPAVAVQEWVDGFELIVDQRDFEEVRDVGLVIVDELLKIAHEGRHLLVMRRNKRGMLQADADPVWLVRNSPGCLCVPRTPCKSTACVSRSKRFDNGR